MIEKTIEELKNTEKNADDRITQAREEGSVRLKELMASLDKEWEKITSDLSNVKDEIFNKYEKEAQEEINSIKEKAHKDSAMLEEISSNKENIIALIIKNLLKEK